jgi:hypothetical protein
MMGRGSERWRVLDRRHDFRRGAESQRTVIDEASMKLSHLISVSYVIAFLSRDGRRSEVHQNDVVLVCFQTRGSNRAANYGL